jgi:hypothetical protein
LLEECPWEGLGIFDGFKDGVDVEVPGRELGWVDVSKKLLPGHDGDSGLTRGAFFVEEFKDLALGHGWKGCCGCGDGTAPLFDDPSQVGSREPCEWELVVLPGDAEGDTGAV